MFNRFSIGKKTWGWAKGACELVNGKLVEIKFALMNQQVADKGYEIYGEDVAWMGVNDIESESNWVYASTGTSITYSNWYSGYPNGVTSKNCAYIFATNYISTHGAWVSYDCNKSRRFMCEI